MAEKPMLTPKEMDSQGSASSWSSSRSTPLT
jgi:hypothetical protein